MNLRPAPKRQSVTIKLNPVIWKRFQLYCLSKGLIPSHVIEGLIRPKYINKRSPLSAEAEAKRLQKLIREDNQ